MKEKWREGRSPAQLSACALTPLAKADVFDIWAYIAENSESAADRVERAIFDACVFLR